MTAYRYFDDITVFSTVDLATGKVVDVQAVQHIPTPLSDGEYEEAIELARDKSDEVQKLYERFGKELTVYPQFSQFAVKDDPRVHRVVHLNYRVGKRDLSYPRPQVDLTTREVVVPAPGGRAQGAGRVGAAAPIEQEDPGMPRSRSRYRLALLVALGVLAPPSSPAVAQRFFRPQALADPPSQEVTAEFLVSESGGTEPRKGTAWKVHYARGLHRGLYITGAWFKRDLGEDWMKVLNDARVSELFVPYHQHSYVRYFDLTGFSFPLAEVKAEDAGPFGTIMPPFQGDTYPPSSRRCATAA